MRKWEIRHGYEIRVTEGSQVVRITAVQDWFPVVYLVAECLNRRDEMRYGRIRILAATILILSGFFIAGAVHAETRLMVLLDASGSMAAPGTPGTSHTKFDEVKSALNNMLQNLPADVAVGLRVVGGSPAADCYTSYLYFTPSQGIRSQFQDSLDAIYPAGARGLYQGMEDSLNDLTGSGWGTVDKVLLVITDGDDECGRDFNQLSLSFAHTAGTPRVVIYGLDLPQSGREALSEFVSVVGGRINDLETPSILGSALNAFSAEFQNNLRIYLQNSSGEAVEGDIIVMNTNTGEIIAERLDLTDFSMTVPPGTYEVTGRYLGQEIRSETIIIEESGSRTVDLEFSVYYTPFSLALRDLLGYPVRLKVTFLNSNFEPVLTTDTGANHRVNLPPDVYSIQVRLGDFVHEVYGIQIGPAFNNYLEIELPIELASLEVEITNIYGTPLNSEIQIFDADGTLVDEAPFSSYLYSRLPPGSYRVTAKFEDYETEETVYVYSGDTHQIGLEIDVALGDIFIMLRTAMGNDVWGWVKVYDMQGNLLERYDRERIEGPDWYLTDVPVGLYRIEAEADNIVRVVSSVEVRENEETEVTIEFPDEIY